MTRATRWITAGVALLALTTSESSFAQDGYRAFQLVYHSDTRGYYRPCG